MRLRIPLQNQWKLNGSSRQVHSGSSTPLENLNRGKCYQLHFGFKQTATHHSTLQGLSCNPLQLFNDNTYEIIQDDKKKKNNWMKHSILLQIWTPRLFRSLFSKEFQWPRVFHLPLNYKLGFAKNTCQRLNNNKGISHLPLQRLNPVKLQLLTFSTLWGSSVWREALCAPGILVEQVFR